MCVLSIKVPIRKKSGNFLNYPCISSFSSFCLLSIYLSVYLSIKNIWVTIAAEVHYPVPNCAYMYYLVSLKVRRACLTAVLFSHFYTTSANHCFKFLLLTSLIIPPMVFTVNSSLFRLSNQFIAIFPLNSSLFHPGPSETDFLSYNFY